MNSTLMRHLRSAIAMLALLCALGRPLVAQQDPSQPPFLYSTAAHNIHPRLVVVISIDQFRADYLTRLLDLFTPPIRGFKKYGGFRYLTGAGSWFLDARYGHIPLSTGPGHSVILTGGYPYKTGIVSNMWVDRATGRGVYCVVDSTTPLVGAASNGSGMSAATLHSTTVGTELKLATGGRAKAVSIALKDRAAILLGGGVQDACIWFEESSGRWISSTAFCPDRKLPAWVEAINNEKIPERSIGTTWELGLSAEGRARAIDYTLPPSFEIPGFGRTFPHRIDAGVRRRFQPFAYSPDANEFVFETARRAIAAEHLGADSIPDILALNLSTNDYIGHSFGPYSLEAIDLAVRTDEQLGRFLSYIDSVVKGGLGSTVVVLTADHGVAPIPESAAELGIRAGRVVTRTIDSVVGAVLASGDSVRDKAYRWRAELVEPYIFINDAIVEDMIASGRAPSRAAIEERVASAVGRLPGIYACFTRTQIMSGMLPQNDVGRHIARGFHPRLSGDVLVLTDPNYLFDDGPGSTPATTHSMPYVYDTHVPVVIAGFGIRSGVWLDSVSPADIAPTLCLLLGIEFPSACDGVPLRSAMK